MEEEGKEQTSTCPLLSVDKLSHGALDKYVIDYQDAEILRSLEKGMPKALHRVLDL